MPWELHIVTSNLRNFSSEAVAPQILIGIAVLKGLHHLLWQFLSFIILIIIFIITIIIIIISIILFIRKVSKKK